MTGSFLTSCEAEVKIKLPELNCTAHNFAPFHVTSQSNYNAFFGQYWLWELGINFDFQNNFVGWKETKIHMKSINYKMGTNFGKILRVQLIELRKFNTPNMKRHI